MSCVSLPPLYADALMSRMECQPADLPELIATKTPDEIFRLCLEGMGYIDEYYRESFNLMYGLVSAIHDAKSRVPEDSQRNVEITLCMAS